MDREQLSAYISPIIELTDDELSLLMTCITHHHLAKGQLVLKEGEVCRAFYLVEKGHLRTYFNKGEVAINLNFTFEGNFTSNLQSFRDRTPSETNIEAGEESLVWIFDMKSVNEQFGEQPQILRFIRRVAMRILLVSEQYSEQFKILTPTERYRHIEKNNPMLLQRIPLSQIASYLGVTRETLSRIRAKKQ